MKPKQLSKKIIYLDYAATTPVDPQVVKSMQPYWTNSFANPSALYQLGRETNKAISIARESIAKILNAKPSEIIFTAGGTESNNIAILGVAQAYQKQYGKAGHIITTAIEHHSVLHTTDALKKWGWKISYAPVDTEGFVNIKDLKKLVKNNTALVSIMYANNEIGTIQPIAEIGKWLTGLNKARTQKNKNKILLHTDACQAAGALSLNTQDLKVDLLTLNGSKVYGPKQTGVLFVKSGVNLAPVIHGGGQERDLRSGTENVPGIIGLAKALQLVTQNQKKENLRLIGLREYFNDRLLKKVKGITVNGPSLVSNHEFNRLPNNLNLTIDGVEGEALMLYLDAAGIQVATGSACTTTSEEPSHVLVAIGVSRSKAYNSIRITLGKQTTKAQLEQVLLVLPRLISQLRATISKL